MTEHPDDPPPEEHAQSGPDGDRKLDEDAAWKLIVDNYGDRAAVDPDPEPQAEPAPETARFAVFERRWQDPIETEATWEDEGHFVPPEPPPLPRLEPRRKLAWIGLFGAPLVMLLAVVFRWSYPTWVTAFMVAAFIGGFVYLVATMPRNPDDWSGDNGAVV
jgi:hypothetical protein